MIDADHELPQAIVNHQASGILQLRWPDGSEDRLPHWLLRTHCRCAGCQASYRLHGALPDADVTIRLEALLPVADRGLNLVFSDGHGRGIFPWRYLHKIGREYSGETGAASETLAS